MKLKITWEGNDDGTLRLLMQRKDPLKIWVLVKDEDDSPVKGPCVLSCRVQGTLFLRWWRRARPRFLSRRRAQPRRLQVLRPNPDAPEFVVTGSPHRFLPYWLKLSAEAGNSDEQTAVFVAPFANRVVSACCVLLFAVCIAYSSWLWLNLSSGSLPQQYLTILGTASAVLGPVVALGAPFISATVRRYALLDALASASLMLASLLLVGALLHYQSPLYIENDTPSAINLGNERQAIVVEPGSAVVVPREHVDPKWLAAIPLLQSDKPDKLEPEHWFKAGEYCIYVSGNENCIELRAAEFFTRLQRWLAPQGGLRIGCKSTVGLEADAIEAWKKSGSCRHDPEVKLTRSLREHLVRSKQRNADVLQPCVEPSGEVTIKPFRSVDRGDVHHQETLGQIPLVWPEESKDSVPSWSFTSTGPIAAVVLHAALDAQGQPCSEPYRIDCQTDDKRCAGLFAPPGALSVALMNGKQALGTLECPAPGNVLAVRSRSRVHSLQIFNEEAGKVVSQFRSDPEAAGGWLAWCEPRRLKNADGQPTNKENLRAELTLAEDWQPVESWDWRIPAASRVNALSLIVRGRGMWGTLICPADGQQRVLWLQEIENAESPALASDGKQEWDRYSDNALFPHWMWRCGSTKDASAKLRATYPDGAQGTLQNSKFTRDAPGACVIDRLTGARVHGNAAALKGAVPAAGLLENFKIAACDSKRSVFAPVSMAP